MNPEYLYFVQIISNVLLLIFCGAATRYLLRINAKDLRYVSIAFLFFAITYNMLLWLVRLPHFEVETLTLISHFIFFTSYITTSFFLLFSLVFLRDYKAFKKPTFWTLLLLNCIFMGLSFTNYLSVGIEKLPSGNRLISGELRPLASLFFLVQLGYMAYVFIRGYRKSQEYIVRKQIALVGLTVFVTLLGGIIFNAIIPTMLGTSEYNFISQILFVILAYFFLYINVSYGKSFARGSLKKLLKMPHFQSIENTLALYNLLEAASGVLAKSCKDIKILERFTFRHYDDPRANDGDDDGDAVHSTSNGDNNKSRERGTKVIYLSTIHPEEEETKTNGKEKKSENIMQYFPISSYIESMQRLERENLSLGLQVQLGQEIMQNHIPEKKLTEYENRVNGMEQTLHLSLDTDRFSALEHSERREIFRFLTKNNFKRSITAKELGITLNTLKNKMKKYNLEPVFFPQKQIEKESTYLLGHRSTKNVK